MKPPVVVVGMDLNGLGVVRSLAAAGPRIVALDPDPTKPTCATRFTKVRRVDGIDGDSLIDALHRVKREFAEKPVLILTQETSVATVSKHHDDLLGDFCFSMPEESRMAELMNKLSFQSLAERLGMPIPRASRLTEADGAAALDTLRFPCVFKPAVKNASYAQGLRKAYLVKSHQEGLALWNEMRSSAPQVIAQEWIEGDDEDVYFCLQYRPANDASVTSFVGRKLRQWPPLVGGTARCVPAPSVEREVRALTNGFFSAIGFVGLCSMEYKRDRRDGMFYMVEPTVGRTDFQEEVASLNGANIPLAAYCGELGLPPPPQRKTKPRGWLDPEGDARAGVECGPGENLDLPMRDAYWRANDPMPWIALRARNLRHRLLGHKSLGVSGR